jgi:hypothetical protein
MVITCERREGAVVVVPYGELDLASAPELERKLREPEQGGERWVTVDLRRLLPRSVVCGSINASRPPPTCTAGSHRHRSTTTFST